MMNLEAAKPIGVRLVRHGLTWLAGVLGVSAFSGGVVDQVAEALVSLVLTIVAVAWSERERRKREGQKPSEGTAGAHQDDGA